MRKLAILTFVSLDGVMQGPSHPEEDTSNGFTSGGWAEPWWEDVMADVRISAMDAPYDLLLGRKTYDSFAAHWASQGNASPEATRLNNATKYVVSRLGLSSSWKNTTVLNGEGAEQVRRLKSEDGRLLQVHGSWELIQELHREGLVDEYRLWIFPVVVGQGKRLFNGVSELLPLTAKSQEILGSGAIRSVLVPS